MECDLLTMDVGSCTDKAFKGFARTGWWTPLSNVDPASIVETDAGVTFALRSGQFYEIFDGSKMPFADTMPVTTFTGKHGFPQHTDKVAFPLKELSPNSSELIKSIASGIPIVIMLEQTDGGDGRFPVYGLFGGLHGSPEMTFELNDERCWEVILEAFNTGYPQRFLFDTDQAGTLAMKTLLTDYEYITGLSIGDGSSYVKREYLESSGTCYIYHLNSNALITSVDNIIDVEYSGIGEAVLLIIPKNGSIDITGSDFIGTLTSNTTGGVTISACQNLTGIQTFNSTAIYCDDSNLSAAMIAVLLAGLVLVGNEDGTLDVQNNAEYSTWSVQAKADYDTLVALGWNIYTTP